MVKDLVKKNWWLYLSAVALMVNFLFLDGWVLRAIAVTTGVLLLAYITLALVLQRFYREALDLLDASRGNSDEWRKLYYRATNTVTDLQRALCTLSQEQPKDPA